MSVDDGVQVLEDELAGLAEMLTAPRRGECLLCFTNRMLVEFGCDRTLRWARRYAQLRSPHAYALRRRLARHGAFCDCEIFANGWDVTVPTVRDPEHGAECWPPEVTGCRRVRTGSTQPCSLWALRRPGTRLR
ncbi:DUF2695 domain-containing protein [Georgenia yuyongxinii]|uniref:DUF2695 domain-containing protein n=1 Tax=Georgenia yuyongxinii TaxID=2589797 RepID=A0A552WVX5_9MICO|nr:DUF2695 domain-containing protein [Georgenia yuyongxinii]TRW46836.1 DUF2695 domain-containing protein [Georgenia yuyongxinii]